MAYVTVMFDGIKPLDRYQSSNKRIVITHYLLNGTHYLQNWNGKGKEKHWRASPADAEQFLKGLADAGYTKLI